MRPQIWIVEDDPSCQFTYRSMLEANYDCVFFEELSQFVAAIGERTPPFLVIADLMLRSSNFLDFFSMDASKSFYGDFIVVSGLDDMDVLRECYEEGALDCLTKPFNKNQLMVKIELILRNKNLVHPSDKLIEPRAKLSVNSHTLEACRYGKVIPLTHKEFQIMRNFTNGGSEIITKDSLIESVWSDISVGRKTLDVHIYNLRKKLRTIGVSIQFERPNSYRMLSSPDGSPPLQ